MKKNLSSFESIALPKEMLKNVVGKEGVYRCQCAGSAVIPWNQFYANAIEASFDIQQRCGGGGGSCTVVE